MKALNVELINNNFFYKKLSPLAALKTILFIVDSWKQVFEK